MEDSKQIQKKQLDISWDYAKQQNDIHCRLYLQFFVVYLTLGSTVSIAILVGELDNLFWMIPLILFSLTFYYIIKLRTLPDELKKSWEYIINELEKLK